MFNDFSIFYFFIFIIIILFIFYLSKKMRNEISRRTALSVLRDLFSGPVSCKNCGFKKPWPWSFFFFLKNFFWKIFFGKIFLENFLGICFVPRIRCENEKNENFFKGLYLKPTNEKWWCCWMLGEEMRPGLRKNWF